jgi:DNA mismatch endonuclease (patch repair protein)
MPQRQSFKRIERRLVRDGVPRTTALASERMSLIRHRNTAPEMRVRRAIAAMGVRYRTGNRDLPGSPDLANRSRTWAIFVHGCFWHHHAGCGRASIPKSNRDFWEAKFAANRTRDTRARHALETMGFRVVTLWECEVHDAKLLKTMCEVLTDRIAPSGAH